MLSLRQREQRQAWVLLAPMLLVMLLLTAWPLLRTIWLSFTDAELASSIAPRMVGMANYARLVQDTEFHGAIRHTLAFTLISVSLEMICGFARDFHQTIILVTHDPEMARYADRIVTLIDGQIVREEVKQRSVQ